MEKTEDAAKQTEESNQKQEQREKRQIWKAGCAKEEKGESAKETHPNSEMPSGTDRWKHNNKGKDDKEEEQQSGADCGWQGIDGGTYDHSNVGEGRRSDG